MERSAVGSRLNMSAINEKKVLPPLPPHGTAPHRSASDTFLWLFTDSQLHSNINYLSRQLQRGFGLFSPLRLAPGRPFYPKGRKAKKNTFAVVGQTSFGRLLPPSVDLSWPWLISKKCIKKRHDARLINANSLAVRKPQQLHRAEFPQRYANEDSVRLKIETLVSFFFGEKIGFIELVEHCASRNGPNDWKILSTTFGGGGH